jgi:hypothetical protein
VSLWWVAGKSWCVAWWFLGAKKMPLLQNLFFAQDEKHTPGARVPQSLDE